MIKTKTVYISELPSWDTWVKITWDGIAWVDGHTCAAFTRKYLDCLSSGSCMSLSFGIASRMHMHMHMHWRNVWVFLSLSYFTFLNVAMP